MGNGRSVLYETVYRYLRSEIENGHFQTGDIIPTEQELMEKFNVSRMTTNRALQMLTGDGFVTRRAGVGTFVLERPPGSPTGEALHDYATSPPQTVEKDDTPPSASHAAIGFVIPWLTHSFGPILISGIEKHLHEAKETLCLACSYGSQDAEQEAIERLVASGVKGLIVFPVNGEFYNPAILKLHVEHFPIVLVDKHLPGLPLPYVTTQNIGAAKELTEHLLQLGHENIAFFSPNVDNTSTLLDRFTGYIQALEGAGIPFVPEYQLNTVPWVQVEHYFDATQVEEIIAFLRRHPEVTAVLATDDELAEYWLAAAQAVGRKVPEELSIACFDGHIPKNIYWTFTSAYQDQEAMAEQALRLLHDLLEGKETVPEGIQLPASLHIGSSTTAPAKLPVKEVPVSG